MTAVHPIMVRPTNWVMPVALVRLREESSYGYELIERLAEFGFDDLNPGTVYRALRRMEREELCQSEWETIRSGPARRMYSVTEKGLAYLDTWAQACEQYQEVLDAFTNAYACNGLLRSSGDKEAS